VLLPRIKAAYEAKDVTRFHALATQWLDDMAMLDRLLASDPHFLLGNWLAHARTSITEAAQQGYDQRAIVTHWGNRSGADRGGLHDYANRELSGLVSGLYAPRWQRYFASLEEALSTSATPQPIDWFAMEQAWSHSHETLPTTAQGDAWQLAAEVAKRLGSCNDATKASDRH
jgi:alpha-N-acetylglucosaminidase